jgi:hypothetical protein
MAVLSAATADSCQPLGQRGGLEKHVFAAVSALLEAAQTPGLRGHAPERRGRAPAQDAPPAVHVDLVAGIVE